MSFSIDVSFVKQYEREVHEAYQRKGSKLRGTVRTKNGVRGSSVVFQKIGKGVAGTKTRHGDVPVMNLDHTNVEATLSDYYAGEWIDSLDELKNNQDERALVVGAGAYALGRKTDALLITAAESTSNTSATGVTPSNGLDLTNALAMYEVFGNADIPDDSNRFAVISYGQFTQLLALKEFASADYVAENVKPFASDSPIKKWNTFMWIQQTNTGDEGRLTLTSGTPDTTTALFYHRTAIGHAIAADVQTQVSFHNDKDSYFFNSKMSQGAVLIDENACYALPLAEV